ncbi:MAG TPA: GNAT family N-acetyltransferase [Vicinamibacteria bacterium]
MATASSAPAWPFRAWGSAVSASAQLLDRLPDLPRHVEARGLLLSGRCEVLAAGDGALLCARETPLVCVVGRPGPAAFAQVLAGAGEHEFLAPATERAFVQSALDEWEAEEAAVHVLPEGTPLPPPLPGIDVGCLDQGDEESLPTMPEDLAHELRTVLPHGLVVVAFDGDEPASFAYASWTTEGWFDLSVDTLAAHRRRRLAEAAARELMALQGAAGRRPVWGAAESNLASRGLARKLGFVEVDRLVVFTRRRGEAAAGPQAALS